MQRRTTHRKHSHPLVAVTVIGLAMAAAIGSATTIRPVAFDEMCDAAELIFDGTVLAVTTHATAGSRRIETRVRFRIEDVIKGDAAGETLELLFLGGAADGRRLVVAEMHYPAVGERGVYFVESLRQRLVHPLIGWSQGHVRVVTDSDGVARVASFDGRPLRSLTGTAPDTADQRGVARGLEVMPADTWQDAVSLEAFKAAVRESLGR